MTVLDFSRFREAFLQTSVTCPIGEVRTCNHNVRNGKTHLLSFLCREHTRFLTIWIPTDLGAESSERQQSRWKDVRTNSQRFSYSAFLVRRFLFFLLRDCGAMCESARDFMQWFITSSRWVLIDLPELKTVSKGFIISSCSVFSFRMTMLRRPSWEPTHAAGYDGIINI